MERGNFTAVSREIIGPDRRKSRRDYKGECVLAICLLPIYFRYLFVIFEPVLYSVFHNKEDTILMVISLPNLRRFSKFFHWPIRY